MRSFAYLGMLAFVVVGTLPLEPCWAPGSTPPRRLLLTLAAVAPVFLIWDLYAIAEGHWGFDPDRPSAWSCRAVCRRGAAVLPRRADRLGADPRGRACRTPVAVGDESG
jgi:lycopene cyclase domain-containing protein